MLLISLIIKNNIFPLIYIKIFSVSALNEQPSISAYNKLKDDLAFNKLLT